jgi:hypothetical protein
LSRRRVVVGGGGGVGGGVGRRGSRRPEVEGWPSVQEESM